MPPIYFELGSIKLCEVTLFSALREARIGMEVWSNIKSGSIGMKKQINRGKYQMPLYRRCMSINAFQVAQGFHVRS